MDKFANLKEFIRTGKVSTPASAKTDTQDAALDIASGQPMDEIVATAVAIEMLAKDLHYRAKGKAFYGIHELADLVWEIGSKRDELNEVYFMGEKKDDPPLQVFAYSHAVGIVEAYVAKSNDVDSLVKNLMEVCQKMADQIEMVKKNDVTLSSGTTAVLDDISKSTLQAIALLRKTAEDDNSGVGQTQQAGLEAEAQDGFLGGLFNRSEAAKKGWETRKSGGGWTPGVWPKKQENGASSTKQSQPSALSSLPAHLTRPKSSRSEFDANRDMEAASH